MRTRRISTLVGSIAAVLVVGLLAAALISSHGGGGTPGTSETGAQQFARVGGTRLVLQVTTCPVDATSSVPACDVTAGKADIIKAMQERIAAVPGIQGVVVTDIGSDQVQIDLPGYTDAMTAAMLFGGNDTFDVVDTNGVQLIQDEDIENVLCPAGDPCPSNAYLVMFTGNQLDKSAISAGTDATTHQPIVTFSFAGTARDQFATYTEQNIGKPLTLTMNGIVIESAIIQSKITGSAEITGLQSRAEAQQLATIMKLGPLPFTATLLSVTVFGPNYSCATPTPGTPGPVSTILPTPGPNATATPKPPATPAPSATLPATPTPTPSGQAANFVPVYNAPVYSGGPGRSGTPTACVTPTVTPTPSGGTPIPPTPGLATATPKP